MRPQKFLSPVLLTVCLFTLTLSALSVQVEVLAQDTRFASAPTAINSADGMLVDVFALGTDGYLYETSYSRRDGEWRDWVRLPGNRQFASAPAAMNSADGLLVDVFALGTDGYLYETFYSRRDGEWRDWVRIPHG